MSIQWVDSFVTVGVLVLKEIFHSLTWADRVPRAGRVQTFQVGMVDPVEKPASKLNFLTIQTKACDGDPTKILRQNLLIQSVERLHEQLGCSVVRGSLVLGHLQLLFADPYCQVVDVQVNTHVARET